MMNNIFLDNKRLNQSEIEERKVVLKSKVTSLVVTLTTKCNISCIMCEEKLIPWDIPETILQEVIGLFPYLEEIIWQGGEILILDYFEQLLEEANRFPDLHQSIITNGLPITEKLAEKLVRNNVELTLSIDAPTKELYESIRRKAKFQELIANIKLINSLRKKHNFKNMSFRMHTVIMNSNYQELEKFVDFAKEYEFDALHLMPIWGNLNSQENIFYHKNEEALNYIKENIGKTEKKAQEYNLNLLNSLPYKGNSEKGRPNENVKTGDYSRSENNSLLCYMPWKRMVINPAGYICPACHCRQMAGNVSEATLSDIWNNKAMQAYRQKIVDGNYEDLCNPDCVKGVISEELRGLR